jgi:hypothetical protein
MAPLALAVVRHAGAFDFDDAFHSLAQLRQALDAGTAL